VCIFGIVCTITNWMHCLFLVYWIKCIELVITYIIHDARSTQHKILYRFDSRQRQKVFLFSEASRPFLKPTKQQPRYFSNLCAMNDFTISPCKMRISHRNRPVTVGEDSCRCGPQYRICFKLWWFGMAMKLQAGRVLWKSNFPPVWVFLRCFVRKLGCCAICIICVYLVLFAV
jgi:hypothetical protein